MKLRRLQIAAIPPVRAVDRALRILIALGERDMRLVDIANELALHKATATRLLASLARAEMVVRNDRGYYGPGPGVALVSTRLLAGYRGLVDALHVPLTKLWEATQETVTLHVRVGLERVCIEELESPQSLAYRTGIGSRAPLHVGSGGKVLLAFLAPDERDHVLRQLRMTPITSRTVTSRARLAAELEEVRRLQYSISMGEKTMGSAAVSVPVFDNAERVVAAVSILGPELRLTRAELVRYAAILKSTIRPLSGPRALAKAPDASS